MSTNISKEKREQLIVKISEIKSFIEKSEDGNNKSNLLSYMGDLQKELINKHYGLIFEEHRENIDDNRCIQKMCTQNIFHRQKNEATQKKLLRIFWKGAVLLSGFTKMAIRVMNIFLLCMLTTAQRKNYFTLTTLSA